MGSIGAVGTDECGSLLLDWETVMPEERTQYIGFKLQGRDEWVWFKKQDIQENDSTLTATNGWGDAGSLIMSITVDTRIIEGRIESESLGHND